MEFTITMIRSPIRHTIVLGSNVFIVMAYSITALCVIILNIIFVTYCIISICSALQNYGHQYCSNSSIPLYVLICFSLSYLCFNTNNTEIRIFTWTINYNYKSFTEKHEIKTDLSLPFYQTIINCILFTWGYVEYYNIQCQNKLDHLPIYTLGKIFMILSCVLMIINFVCIFVYRDNIFATTTITRTTHNETTTSQI